MSTLDHLKGMLSGVAERGQGQAVTGLVSTLPVDALSPSRYQPRRHFDEGEMQELTASVKENGILQPLLVRVTDRGHEIVAGERRWRAAQQAGLRDVPVYVKQMTEQDARLFGLMENLQRSDVSPFDEIEGKLHVAAVALNLTPEQARSRMNELIRNPEPETVAILDHLFRQIGRETWESYARNKLRVFGWPEPVLQAMREGLAFTTAGVIAAAPEAMQTNLLNLALQGASRSQLQAEIKKATKPTRKTVSTTERARAALANRKKMAALQPEQAERVQSLLNQLLKELGEDI